jgi:hypothetical protein
VLFPAALWPALESGEVTVAFRSWKRPTVKAGGTLITPAGQLAIDAVDPIDPTAITDGDARLAGAPDADAVRAQLRPGDDRRTYRIAFHRLGDDPRIALRGAAALEDQDREAIRTKLDGHDRRSPTGPWTARTLELIGRHPGVVSTELAERQGLDRPTFKANVRKLKALGLTESLEVGYRLSPRGEAYVAGDGPA